MASLILDRNNSTLTISELTASQLDVIEHIIQKNGEQVILAGIVHYFKTMAAQTKEKELEEIQEFIRARLTDVKRDAILAIIRQA